MGLNQILENEQIAMMRHAAATTPCEIQEHRRKLGRIAGKLSLFAYPHRPYVSRNPQAAASCTKGTSPAASLARWENEGGAL
jgi:hypothetical protein